MIKAPVFPHTCNPWGIWEIYNMHILEKKCSLSEVSDAGGILENHLEDKDSICVLLGNHIMAEGPVLVMPIDGQGSDSARQQEGRFYFYCEVLCLLK